MTLPQPGLFHARIAPGSSITAGTVLGELRGLPDGQTIQIRAGVDGVLYAREAACIVRAGSELFFIAGTKIICEGALLSM